MLRYKYLFFYLLLLYPLSGSTQPCTEGSFGYYISSQADIDSFPILFPDCDKIGGFLNIHGVDTIYNLLGFNQLTEIVNGGIKITATHITDLKGFDSLSHADYTVQIFYNDNLQNLDGFQNMTHVHDNFFIGYNHQLQSLHGLDNFIKVRGNFTLIDNPLLPNLSPLGKLAKIEGEFTLEKLNGLHDLQGLEKLDTIEEHFKIRNNQNLYTLQGCNALKDILGNFTIKDNPALGSLEGLDSLQTIGQNLSLINNASLVNLEGLLRLNFIDGHLLIDHNSEMQSLEGAEHLYEIGGFFHLLNNDKIHDLQGLDSLQSIQEEFFIQQNDSLKNLHGLEQLQYVQDFILSDNATLSTLEGAETLQIIDDKLILQYLPALSDISALENVLPEELNYLQITNNPALSTCNLPNICSYLFNGGSALIENNGPGCSSPEEIIAQCPLTDAPPGPAPSLLRLYPNPAQNTLWVAWPQTPDKYELRIYDPQGRMLYAEKEVREKRHQIPLQKLPAGSYLLQVRNEEQVYSLLFVVK